MPESNAAKVRRHQKQNRLNGIGDENGRLIRQKEPPKISKCTICQHELKITKTNTEIIAHSVSKHNQSDIEICFPGATQTAKDLIAATTKTPTSTTTGSSTTTSKKSKDTNLDDLLSAGLKNASIKKK